MHRTLIRELRLSEEEVTNAVIFWLKERDIPFGDAYTVTFLKNSEDQDYGIHGCLIQSSDSIEMEIDDGS